MLVQIFSIVVLGLIFLIATWKPIHLGLLGLTAAFGIGYFLAGESFVDIMDGFPVNILVLLVGVTYLFGIARESGVVDWIIHRTVLLTGGRIALLPWVFFLLSLALGSVGSPLIGTAIVPIAMVFVGRHKLDPALMGLAVILGSSAGGFAPTSLFGLITDGVATENGIPTEPLMLYGASVAFNAVLMTVAFILFGGRSLLRASSSDMVRNRVSVGATSTVDSSRVDSSDELAPALVQEDEAGADGRSSRLDLFQIVCLASLIALAVIVVTLSLLGVPADVGVIAIALAVVVSIMFPSRTKPGLLRIDWSTILLVGGIVTYVGVLQNLGTLDVISDGAGAIEQPLLAALALCIAGGLISAFASTTGILGALIPLAIPLMGSNSLTGYGLVIALAICSSVVDTMPFSTAGATAVASAPEASRPRLTKLYIRWGLTMVIVGPLVTVSTLVLPSL